MLHKVKDNPVLERWLTTVDANPPSTIEVDTGQWSAWVHESLSLHSQYTEMQHEAWALYNAYSRKKEAQLRQKMAMAQPSETPQPAQPECRPIVIQTPEKESRRSSILRRPGIVLFFLTELHKVAAIRYLDLLTVAGVVHCYIVRSDCYPHRFSLLRNQLPDRRRGHGDSPSCPVSFLIEDALDEAFPLLVGQALVVRISH